MMLTLAAALVLSLLVRSSSQECGGNAKQLISDPDVLVSISANPLLEMNPKVDPIQLEVSENNTDPWCSTPPTARAAFNPYLIFEFSSTYLIEVITISGRSASNRFVEALTIKNDTGQGFAFINNNGIPKVFHTRLMDASDVRNISFMEEPILATSLQIRPLNWTSNSPCMKIELYGCLYNNSQNLGFETLTNNTDGDLYPQRGVLITLGIGAGFAGSLVTIVIILAAVCCCRLIKKRELRPTDAGERIYSTSNEAYGIAQKDNIELQANECYKPVSLPAEQASTSQHDDSEYTYPVLPTTIK